MMRSNSLADKNGVTITDKDDMDIDSFQTKKAVDGVDEWFVRTAQEFGDE